MRCTCFLEIRFWYIPESLNIHVYSLAALILENCDLDCGTNNRNHHTAEAGFTKLIVRRGQAFEIKLQFSSRGYEEGVDQLALIAKTGNYIPGLDHHTSPQFKEMQNLRDNM